MFITAREGLILETLLETPGLFVSLEDLSKILEVSVRTIQRELKLVEATLSKFDLKLDKKANEGIRIEGSEAGFKNLAEILSGITDNELTPEERILFIFNEFLQDREVIKSAAYLKELGVSSNTLQQDLNKFQEEIKGYSLVLNRKPGFGIALEGSEKNKRMCFVQLTVQSLEQNPVYSLKEGEFLSVNMDHPVVAMINQGYLEPLEKIILEEIKALSFKLTDLALFEVLLYMNLTLQRVNQKNYVGGRVNDEVSEEAELAMVLSKRIANELKIELPEEEVAFLTSYLKSAKRIRKLEVDDNIMLSQLASELIDSVTLTTGYYFSRDKNFFDALLSHLEPLLNRMAHGINVFNPIKDEIKEDYGLLFGTIEQILKEKFPDDHISDDEIGFLTLHFASAVTELKEAPKVSTLVVCTSGIATSRMLTKKLLRKFPQLTIIEQGSIQDLRKMDMSSFDLVISTVGIKDASFNYIQVSPLLSKEDERKLQRVINDKLLVSSKRKHREIQTKPNVQQEFNLLHSIRTLEKGNETIKDLMESFALYRINESSEEGLFLKIRQCISKKRSLSPEVFETLEQRTLKSGAGIPGTTIALIHGRSELVENSTFSVFQNLTSVKMLGMDKKTMEVSTILFLLTPEVLEDIQLEIVSSISIGLLEEKNVEIYEKGSEKEIVTLLENQLKNTLAAINNRIWR